MERINFSISINAPKEKGSKVLFLDGNGAGMVSKVAANKPNEYMPFKHLGEVNDGVKDVSSEKVKDWAGSMENYTLKEAGSTTELKVEMPARPFRRGYHRRF